MPGATQLSGASAFQLHDTYGFPIDLTLEMAAEQGIEVDEAGFRRLMAEQRARAKADAQAKKTAHVDLSLYRSALREGLRQLGTFTGYTEVAREAHGRVDHRPERAAARRPARATRSRSCSTPPRSTPRAAASSPTGDASPSTPAAARPSSPSSTSSSRCRG